ncbi:MAG: methyltransferase domain-containing protein [Desulfobacteraceae bacterium]|nr:methyltransferase domain-containing protein [Desulfobacteraceae bacterium]
MEDRKISIPDTDTLKRRISEQISSSWPEASRREIYESQAMEVGYHGLFVRLKQEGIKGKVKAIVFDAIRFVTLWQERINHGIHQALMGLGQSMIQLNQRQEKQGRDVERIIGLQSKVQEQLTGLQSKVQEQLTGLQSSVQAQMDEHRQMMFQHQRSLDLFLELARRRFPQPFEKHEIDAISKEANHSLDGVYMAFENQFRGEREAIKKRLSVYLPLIQTIIGSEKMTLDIGCGRGEWLEILKHHGVKAKGIDTNRVAVRLCRDLGLDVEETDALMFLKTLTDSTCHAVTGFHIIEHLPFEHLIVLLDEVYRVLIPGGIAIFETPNPANILVSAYDFYRDASHIKPVHPDTVRFFAEFRGFEKTAIYLVQQSGDQCQLIDFKTWRLDTLQNYIDIPRDYALIAHKSL